MSAGVTSRQRLRAADMSLTSGAFKVRCLVLVEGAKLISTVPTSFPGFKSPSELHVVSTTQPSIRQQAGCSCQPIVCKVQSDREPE